jgi:hypothetical protein
MFDQLNWFSLNTAAAAAKTKDELQTYLDQPCEVPDTHVLLWWERRKGAFPALSRMALDYLSAPGKPGFSFPFAMHTYWCSAASVECERVFSKGCDVVAYRRNRLTANRTRALLCVANWLSHDILTVTDMAKYIKAAHLAAAGV